MSTFLNRQTHRSNSFTTTGFRLPVVAVALLALLVTGWATPSAQAAPSLVGEQVTLTVRYQTLTQESVSIDQVLYTSSFTVGAGPEVTGAPFTYTYTSGGFPQTISGNVSADIGSTNMSVSFSGTQQPGSLLFVLSSVTDQSAGSIGNATLNGSSGFQSGINQTLAPSFNNSGNGSVTANFFLGGYQPGVGLGENVGFSLLPPPTLPTVTTAAATGVTASAATLNGTVNANGSSTTATFEYGLTTSYGNSVAATPGTVTGSTATNITATLTGLIPGATYHFRAVGKVTGAVTNGADQTFAIAATSTVSVLGTPGWTNSNFTNAGATYTNFTVPAGTNRVLVVAASGENYLGSPAINLSNVTFNSSSLTLGVKKTDTNYLVDGLYYIALGTSVSSTTANIVVTGSGVTTVVSIGAVVFQNVDQTTPLSGFQTAMNTNGNNISLSVTVASTNGDMVMDLMDIYDATKVFKRTMGAGQTSAFTGGDPVPFSGTEFYTGTLKAGATSVPMTWATSANEAIQIAANIKQAPPANVAPVITLQPTNLTVNSGSTASFSAAASGTPTPTLQWQESTNGGASFTNLTGVTSSPLVFTAGIIDNGRQYRAIFTNVAGSATNTPATLTVIGPAAKLVFVQQPTNATASSSITPAITVQVQDAAGHFLTNSTASVTLVIASNPGSGALSGTTNVNAVGGIATFSGLSINKAGAGYTLSATSGVLTSATSSTFNITPGAATHFTVSAPGSATAGSAFNFTVTALDAFNNTATGYSGTAHFTSTDGAATLPANATLTSGAGTFSATLKTAGNQTVAATDTVSSSITGTSGSIAVSASAATHFTVSAPANATAGTAFNFTVTALDTFNNTATAYSGTAHFTSTDGSATLPANSTLTSGAGTFSATLKTSGARTITTTDTVSGSIKGTSGNITVAPGTATHFTVSAPATANAGTAFNVTVTALDAFNNTATAYSGTAHFTSSDGAAVLPANSTLTSGVGTFSATLKTIGNQTITATDTVSSSINGTSGNISVAAGLATHFAVTAPANATAGTAFNFTVTALDAFDNTATAYSGTVHFTSTDGAAALPANATLTSGVGTFSATLKTAGTRTVTATDTVSGSINGTSGSVGVTASVATHFAVSAPTNTIAGIAFNFTVSALDAFNNTDSAYSGTAHFTSTDGAATLPADATLVNGAGTFSATLTTSGARTITATDTVSASINGTSGNITVTGSAATHFTVSAPANATAGLAFNFTVTALDAFDNTATAYSGTAHFTSTDAAAVLPADATLTNGIGTFGATLKTIGNQTITAADTVSGPINGTSGNINVAAGVATHFGVSAPANATAGTAFNFTVTALDAFNNTATAYSGTAHFTSTDGAATLPANATLTSGLGTFSAALKTSGNQTITATDTISNSISGTSSSVTVGAGAATHLAVSAPANATAGTAFNFTVTAQDQFNNTASNYSGTTHFTSTDGAAVLPADSTLTSGVGTFSATLKTSGTQTIAATDIISSSINGTSGNISVVAGAATHFTVSGAPTNAIAGIAFNLSVTALDQFNNVDTGYVGTAHFTSTDAAATLPADSTLTSGTGTFSVTMKTVGTRRVTVTDSVSSSITGLSGNVRVTAAAAAQFFVSAPTNATAGVPFNFTIITRDAFNNLVTNYSTTVHITSTDGAAVLPADKTISNGFSSFSVTLTTAGAQTVTASDTINPSVTGTSGSIGVAAAAATHFVVSAPANAIAGNAFNFTVTAQDQFNNTATGYSGTAHFTSTDGAAVLPADTTLTSGASTFSATLKTAGNHTIAATDTASASINGTSGNIALTAGAATHFTVSAPANAGAGTAFNVTVTALDAFNNVASGYSGTAHFTSADGAAVLPADSTLTSGVGTFSATLKTAGNQTVTVTDTISSSVTGTSGSIGVSPAAATHFVVSAPANATAGTAFNFTVTALDAFNNTAIAYSGIAHFTSTDAAGVLPADATLTSGFGTFSATLKTAGTQAVTATDTVSGAINGTSGSISVAPAAATHFTVSAPGNATAGSAFNFAVTAQDQFNNTATAYSGTTHFTSTDGSAVLPADAVLVNGAGNFSATLKTSGVRTITATDTVTGSINGTSGNVAVSPAAATHLTVSASGNATAGTAFNVTVAALDQFGNTDTAYAGTVHFTSTDAAAVLPPDSALTSGAGTFSATLKTAGGQTVSATDTVIGSINGVTGSITVNPAAATHFTLSAPAIVKARIATNFVVTALDTFGNTATTYAGMIHFTSIDGLAVLPVNTTLVGGVQTFSLTMGTAGIQTVTATDTVNSSVTGSSGGIEVLDLQIVVPPVNQFALPGSNATFNVAVSGTAPFAYQWLTNNVNVPGATNSSLTVFNVTTNTTTNYQVIITNAWGSVTSSVVTLALSGSLTYTNTLRSGSGNLNPVTGLYEEYLTVTNVGGTFSGLRLLVSNLPPQVSLYHAAGTNGGRPYVDFAVTMTNGQTGTFLLQFLNPFRIGFTNTVEVVALNSGSGSAGTTNTVAGIPISTVLVDNTIPGSPRFTLAFTSIVGRNYQVLYSDDQMQTWALADTLTANATWTIWTELLPAASGNRFFKVIVLP